MFYRNIALTFALVLMTALASLALIANQGQATETVGYGKRQDRLMPAGGMSQSRAQTGYGVDVASKG